MKCPNCNEIELTEKQTYCSDRCRIAYTRRTKKGEQPEQIDPEQPTRTFDFTLTRTDKEWEADKPGYYNFGAKEYTKNCFICKKEFKTHLQLLKVCSQKCKREFFNFKEPTEGQKLVSDALKKINP